jgi:hypothetical protein
LPKGGSELRMLVERSVLRGTGVMDMPGARWHGEIDISILLIL